MVSFRRRSDRHVAMLKGVALLSGCNDSELRHIASLTSEITVPAGEILARQNEPGSEFLIIAEGRALASGNGAGPAILGPSTSLVELALIDGGRRTADIRTETDVRLLVLSRRDFNSMVLSCPTVANKIMKDLAGRLRRAEELLECTAELDRRPVRTA